MSRIREVQVSTASWQVAAVAAVAVAVAGLHVWFAATLPFLTTFVVLAAIDLFVASVALWLARKWPRLARFTDDTLTLGRDRIPYTSITDVRTGAVSAKPFWLAFWLPISLVVGLIVALRPAHVFDRQVVEIDTPDRRYRLRWRNYRQLDDFLDALRVARPDIAVEPLGDRGVAVDRTPRQSVGGGFLAFGLLVWLVVVAMFTTQAQALPEIGGAETTATGEKLVRDLTGKLDGFATVPGLRAEYRTYECLRPDTYLLGIKPDVEEVYIGLEDRTMPQDEADALELAIRAALGMEPGDYTYRLREGRAEVDVGIPISTGLQVEISVSCVDQSGQEALRAALADLAVKLGAER